MDEKHNLAELKEAIGTAATVLAVATDSKYTCEICGGEHAVLGDLRSIVMVLLGHYDRIEAEINGSRKEVRHRASARLHAVD